MENGQCILTLERKPACAHLIQDDTKAEEIRSGVDGGAAGLFRGHVGRRAEDDAGLRQFHIAAHQPRQPEIQNVGSVRARFQPDVGRFDVAMNEALGVGRSQSAGHLPGHVEHLGRRATGPVLEPIIQAFAAQVAGGNEGNAAVFADLEDGKDVFVIQHGRRLGFEQKPLAEAGHGGNGRLHGFEGNAAFQARVLGQEHHAHAAGAEQFQQAVLGQPADFILGLGWRKEREKVTGLSTCAAARHGRGGRFVGLQGKCIRLPLYHFAHLPQRLDAAGHLGGQLRVVAAQFVQRRFPPLFAGLLPAQQAFLDDRFRRHAAVPRKL